MLKYILEEFRPPKDGEDRRKTMKSTGIVRNIDELGRLVVPKEMRKNLDINCNDPVEFFAEGDKIIIKKYSPNCIFCGGHSDLTVFKEKKICAKCLHEIKD